MPLVTLDYPPGPTDVIKHAAGKVGAPLHMRYHSWYTTDTCGLLYIDHDGELDLPRPALSGAHQALNAGLAVAMLRHQRALSVGESAMAQGLRVADWPARLQRLSPGPLTVLVPDMPLWLDGGHNPDAGQAVAAFFVTPVHLIIGMLANKNPRAIIDPLGDKVRSLTVVPVPGSESHGPEAFGPDARSASNVEEALLALPSDDYPVLIAGSLYLAGEVLRLNDEIPD